MEAKLVTKIANHKPPDSCPLSHPMGGVPCDPQQGRDLGVSQRALLNLLTGIT